MDKNTTLPSRLNEIINNPNIWILAIGYFAFYVPYSAMTKALSKGLFPGSSGHISGFELLPSVIFGTVISFIIILAITGWWKYAGRLNVAGIKIPFATSKWTFFSGMASAAIIASTTLAYAFEGISIVFAALLMRGGVLLMAPLWDLFFRRKVSWYSWVAFGLSFCALILLFSEKGGYMLTLIAVLNIASYLSGYFFRLQFMTRKVKTNNKALSYRFFVEEMMAAMLVLLAVPFIGAFIGKGGIFAELYAGLTTFVQSQLFAPALLIGALYACLYIFGTRIYLYHKENTFCVPVNRCASLLAGVVASFILGHIFQASFVSNIQLASSGILIVSILFLSMPNLIRKDERDMQIPFVQNYLFICSQNTSRSPMAHYICVHEMKRILRRHGIDFDSTNIKVASAGLSVGIQKPLSENSKAVLSRLKIPFGNHVSQQLKIEDVQNADKIFCMSDKHLKEVVGLFPMAKNKIECLLPGGAVNNPAGGGMEAYMDCARQLQKLIQGQLVRPVM